MRIRDFLVAYVVTRMVEEPLPCEQIVPVIVYVQRSSAKVQDLTGFEQQELVKHP